EGMFLGTVRERIVRLPGRSCIMPPGVSSGPRMIIIGINAFHGDSSACLVRDGVMLAAAEEERFRRVKHWAGFPAEAIRYCLAEAGVTLSHVDQIAVNQDTTANLGKRVLFMLGHRPDLGMVLDRIRNKLARAGVKEHLARAF